MSTIRFVERAPGKWAQPSVRRRGQIVSFSPAIWHALHVVASVWDAYDLGDLEVTTGVDGEHRRKSLHYSGNAVDIRNRHVPLDKRDEVLRTLRNRLGEDFDVIFERTHCHVEFDPKDPPDHEWRNLPALI